MDFQLEKFKEFEEKSNKEKCVLMWEWIVKEKSCSKSQFFVSKFGINSLYGAHLFPFNSLLCLCRSKAKWRNVL